jgi:hypothetical protein
MLITRENLIQLCDKFLNNEVNKSEIKNFASTLVFSDSLDWDDEDEVMSDVIHEWHKDDKDMEINKANMEIWKQKLQDGF